MKSSLARVTLCSGRCQYFPGNTGSTSSTCLAESIVLATSIVSSSDRNLHQSPPPLHPDRNAYWLCIRLSRACGWLLLASPRRAFDWHLLAWSGSVDLGLDVPLDFGNREVVPIELCDFLEVDLQEIGCKHTCRSCSVEVPQLRGQWCDILRYLTFLPSG